MRTPFKKIEVGEDMTTDELLTQIERKDQIFRFAQAIFMVSTLFALLIVIGVQQRTLSRIEQQQASYREDSKLSQDKILRRLDCMTVFFSQKDRTDLTIQNIDECTLERDGDIQRFFTNDKGGGTTGTKTEQPEGTQTPKATAP